MKIVIPCYICKKEYELEVKPADVKCFNEGAHVQDAFPYLTAGERELILSRTCNTCFDKMFEEED